MSSKFKSFCILLVSVSLFMLVPASTFAADAVLTLFPGQGSVVQGDDFVVDILIDTKGEEIVMVRTVLSFDPELVQLDTVVTNEDLFCIWPETEQLIDNDNGLYVATGFCQSGGEDPLYATTGEADVFSRLTFSTQRQGSLRMEWIYSGIDEPMNSVVISDGSPPQNILLFDETPLIYEYMIVAPAQEPKMPETSISAFENLSSTFILGGSVFLLALITNVLLDPRRKYFGKARTIVVYDDEKK